MARCGLVILPIVCSGCASSQQARKVKPSGFLGNYGDFVKGGRKEPRLIYHGTDSLSGYHSIRLDPVQVYLTEKSRLRKLKKEDFQILLNYFDATLRRGLATAYPLTDQTGPGVLRMRIALTKAKASIPVFDLLSNVVPYSLAAPAVQEVLTGTPPSVGKVQMELELHDAQSGKCLEVAVDARVGTKVSRGKFDKRDDVKSSFDLWAEQAARRMAKARREADPAVSQREMK